MAEQKKVLNPGDPQAAKEFFLKKMQFTTGPMEVSQFQKDGEDFVFVDLRDSADFAKGHPAGAINLPHDKWDTFAGLAKDKVNILMCYTQNCHLASKAAVKFAARGYPVMELDGGFAVWEEHKLPVESGATVERKSA